MRTGSISGVGGLVCAVWLVACGSSGREAPASTGPVGEAVQVMGSVSVVHDGAEQPLAVGGKVFGADEIVTGADGAVTIRLFHNEARWTLESGKRKRVDTSLAWTAPKQVGGGVLAGSDTAESTAAAGRHTEKEAADTRATAARVGSADEAKPDPVAAESRADSPAPAPPPPQRPKTRSRGSADKRDVLRKLESNDGFGDFEGGGGLGITGGSGRGGGGDGTIGTGIGGSIGTGGTGGGYGTGSGGAKRKPSAPSLSGGAPSVSGNLDAGAIRRVIQAHMNRLRYCHARALETQPGLAGKILVKFTITAKGTATNVKTSADPALEKEVAPCVVATIEKMKFSAPPGGKPVEISYPLVFKAE